MRSLMTSSLLAVTLITSGCATILGKPTQTMPIASTPDGATIVVVDESGAEVFRGNTPTTVTLSKHNGRYFGGKTFRVSLIKDGYKSQEVPVYSGVSGWYFGNILLGGLIGMLVVDPLNGGMYTLSPEVIAAAEKSSDGKTVAKPASTSATAPAPNHNNSSADGISIIMLKDVPANLVSELKPLK
jgi:hypothetical protein